MTIQTMNILAFGSLILAALCLFYVSSNPYRVRRVSSDALNSLIPTTGRDQITSLGDAWAGRIRITEFQIKIITYAGLLFGIMLGLILIPIVDTTYGILIAAVLGGIFFYYPRQRFLRGFPKTTIEKLEREAPIFAAFMHRSIGITGLSVQMSFEQFIEIYPEKETTKLLQQIPEGQPFAEELLTLNLPSQELSNWLQIVQSIASISDFGDPETVLREVRDRIRSREEQYLRMIIKRKSFAAPATTVVLMLPALMCVLIGAVILQAMQALGGGF